MDEDQIDYWEGEIRTSIVAANEQVDACPQPESLSGMTIQQKFEQFHHDNPHVFQMFVSYARQAKKRGYDRFSAKAIFERLRWYSQMETDSADEWKLNNSFTALYARKAIAEYPEFEGFFQLRERLTK